MRSSVRIVALALALGACSDGPRGLGAATLSDARYGRYDVTGIGTWYGEEAAGARTASGEWFDPAGITAAHRTLPLNSYVEVTSLATGRSIVARINDRGPGRRDRLIDLSRGAAHLLGTDRIAMARVRVRALEPGDRPDPGLGNAVRASGAAAKGTALPDFPIAADGGYAVQVASFSNAARADALAARIGGSVDPVDGVYRVRLGPYADGATAQRARDAAAARGYGDARVLAEDR